MALTDVAHWDAYWRDLPLPMAMSKGTSLRLDLLLDALDEALDVRPGDRVLEVGGAPGAYLAHFAGRGADLALLDYSTVGCEAARRNLAMLGLDADVIDGDLFAPPHGLAASRVYSLGVVEHFDDLEGVLSAHLELVTEGGRLVVGFPNFGGVYRPLLRWQRPADLADIEPKTMDLRNWPQRVGSARVVSSRYVMGFTPEVMLVLGSRRLDRRVLAQLFRLLAKLMERTPLARVRRLDSRWVSGYALVVLERDVA